MKLSFVFSFYSLKKIKIQYYFIDRLSTTAARLGLLYCCCLVFMAASHHLTPHLKKITGGAPRAKRILAFINNTLTHDINEN